MEPGCLTHAPVARRDGTVYALGGQANDASNKLQALSPGDYKRYVDLSCVERLPLFPCPYERCLFPVFLFPVFLLRRGEQEVREWSVGVTCLRRARGMLAAC